jgi:hypothetical protein
MRLVLPFTRRTACLNENAGRRTKVSADVMKPSIPFASLAHGTDVLLPSQYQVRLELMIAYGRQMRLALTLPDCSWAAFLIADSRQ